MTGRKEGLVSSEGKGQKETVLPKTFHERVARRSTELSRSRGPQLVDLSSSDATEQAQELVKSNPTAFCLDLAPSYADAFCRRYYPREYNNMANTEKNGFQRETLKELKIEDIEHQGTLAYFPFSNALVRYAPDNLHYAVRVASNRGLTKPETQLKLKDHMVVGFAGLSVGYAHAMSASLEGLRGIRAIDDDIAEPENFNRLPFPLTFHGAPKAKVLEELTLINDPYSQVAVQHARLNRDTVHAFIFGAKGDKPLDLIVDEVDDPDAKDLIREYGKKYGIDVVSIADLGEGRSKGDYEAYSTNPDQLPYNGALDRLGITPEIWSQMSKAVKIAAIVDPRQASLGLLQSFPRVVSGELPSWPQDAGTILSAAGATPYLIKSKAEGRPPRPIFIVDASANINPEHEKERREAELYASQLFAHLLPQ